MATKFGIITPATGIPEQITINSLTRSKSAESAEARNEKGQVTDLKAYSKGESISITGVLKADGSAVEPGTKITIDSKDYIIESAEQTESNTEFVQYSITARTADSAEITEYEAGV